MDSDSARALAVTAARATGRGLIGVIGTLALALVLNGGLLVALWPTLGAMGERIGGVHTAGGSWFALLFLAFVYWPITLTVCTFALAFPAAYFVLAKKHALQTALAELVRAHGGELVEVVAERFADLARARLGAAERERVQQLVEAYFAALDGVPAPLRPLVRALDARADVRGLLLAALDQAPEADPLAGDAFVQAARTLADRVLRERVTAPKRGWLVWLVATNLVAALAVRVIAG